MFGSSASLFMLFCEFNKFNKNKNFSGCEIFTVAQAQKFVSSNIASKLAILVG